MIIDVLVELDWLATIYAADSVGFDTSVDPSANGHPAHSGLISTTQFADVETGFRLVWEANGAVAARRPHGRPVAHAVCLQPTVDLHGGSRANSGFK